MSFSQQDYAALKEGKPIQIDLTKTEQTYRKMYGYDGRLDDCKFEYEPGIYIYGLKIIEYLI